eukprot:TRINITY_DN16920_c0_g1_i3.p1 TRINITY_DN16920_c0_g1~~TRINITY_DN16920_c0_g1_i3.p1  ORF type:complete len:549 (+),score=105.53 TRINITY_DN16920_c0_g1_i3:74-1648(+)
MTAAEVNLTADDDGDACGGFTAAGWAARRPPQEVVLRLRAKWARRVRYCGWEVSAERPSNPSLAVWDVAVDGGRFAPAVRCAASPGPGVQLWALPHSLDTGADDARGVTRTLLFRLRVLDCFGEGADVQVDRILLLDACAATSSCPHLNHHVHAVAPWSPRAARTPSPQLLAATLPQEAVHSGGAAAAGAAVLHSRAAASCLSASSAAAGTQQRRAPWPARPSLDSSSASLGAVPGRGSNLSEAISYLADDISKLRRVGRPSCVTPPSRRGPSRSPAVRAAARGAVHTAPPARQADSPPLPRARRPFSPLRERRDTSPLRLQRLPSSGGSSSLCGSLSAAGNGLSGCVLGLASDVAALRSQLSGRPARPASAPSLSAVPLSAGATAAAPAPGGADRCGRGCWGACSQSGEATSRASRPARPHSALPGSPQAAPSSREPPAWSGANGLVGGPVVLDAGRSRDHRPAGAPQSPGTPPAPPSPSLAASGSRGRRKTGSSEDRGQPAASSGPCARGDCADCGNRSSHV